LTIIDQIIRFISNETNTVTIIFSVVVIVIALAFIGARRMETD